MNAPVDMALVECMESLARVLQSQRRAFELERYPSLAVRRERLARLLDLVTGHEDAWAAAADRDFGHRSTQETRLADVCAITAEVRHAMRRLRGWMKPQRVQTPLSFAPATAWVLPQPLGVVGVIGAWHYPLAHALLPVVAALAAGNRVMLKPSERAPATAALLAELAACYFTESELAVVQGAAGVGAMFAALPFDHLLFTGSAEAGRRVAAAAAENLTPVTLELGGKSPAILDDDADLDLAATSIARGKLLNAGQACIAPDYALVPRRIAPAFVAALRGAVERIYASAICNPDYSSIIDTRHYARLIALLEDARGRGARIVPLGDSPAGDTEYPRRLPPALVLDVTDDMALMRDEIAGPLLPVETCATIDEAIAKVNARPAPLALYWFGRDRGRTRRVLRETRAGGVTVNDTLWHFAHPGLPFGGVGASGSGAHHGGHGFARFSHMKPVFVQPRLAPVRLLAPPYGARFERVLALLQRASSSIP